MRDIGITSVWRRIQGLPNRAARVILEADADRHRLDYLTTSERLRQLDRVWSLRIALACVDLAWGRLCSEGDPHIGVSHDDLWTDEAITDLLTRTAASAITGWLAVPSLIWAALLLVLTVRRFDLPSA